jgi:hypothetical protein
MTQFELNPELDEAGAAAKFEHATESPPMHAWEAVVPSVEQDTVDPSGAAHRLSPSPKIILSARSPETTRPFPRSFEILR